MIITVPRIEVQPKEFYFHFYLFIYLFGCVGSLLWPVGSFIAVRGLLSICGTDSGAHGLSSCRAQAL